MTGMLLVFGAIAGFFAGNCNFGNNFSVFDWLFGTARLVREDPAVFGVEASHYPQEDLLGQFRFAFRPGRYRRGDAVPVAPGPAGAAWS